MAALPEESRILDLPGRSLQGLGDANLAQSTYLRMAELMPQSPLPYWRLADVQLGARDREGAIQSLQKATTIQGDFLEAQRALIGLYMLGKRQNDALQLARKVQAQRTQEDAGYIMEADIWAASKNWEQSTSLLRSGLKRLGTTPLAMKLHTTLLAAAKVPEAEQFSRQWQQDHPRDAAFLFYLGDQALARKNYSAAEGFFNTVLQLQPDNPMVLNNLAWVRGKLKKEGAIALAEKAVALAPQQSILLDTLASLYSEQGDYDRALALQNRALELQANNPMLRLNLAIIHLRAGKPALAQASLNALNTLGDKLATQLRKHRAALVEKIVQQLGRHHRVVGGEVAPCGHGNVAQRGHGKVIEQVLARRLAAVHLAQLVGHLVQVNCCTDCGCAIGKIVVVDRVLHQALKQQKRLIHLNAIGIDRNHQVPGVEESFAILVHELHQREQYGAAGIAKAGVHGKCRHLGYAAALFPQGAQIKNRLHGKAEGALANQRNRPHHLAIPQGAQRGGGGQGLVDVDAHATGVGAHEAAAHVGVMQQAKAGLQFLAALGDLQAQARAGRIVAIDHGTVGRKAQGARQQGQRSQPAAVQKGGESHGMATALFIPKTLVATCCCQVLDL